MKAVVFAYHNVGVRCLKVLLARGVDVALVVSHEDNPQETIWFDSVSALCQEQGIPVVTPADPSDPELFAQISVLKPDFIFSFYYRHMLSVKLLALATHGAFNMHGSLLPKYRGRVPINWAVLHGETETGATLHKMALKPDAGVIVAQTSVPILPDDTAHEVFGKVVVAAEQTLWNALPAMLAGAIPAIPNNLSQGSYFGGRKPADGKIDWQQTAQSVYNLYRAVAPPYPGAWTVLDDVTFVIENARLSKIPMTNLPIGLAVVDNCIFGVCGDGRALLIKSLSANGKAVTAQALQTML
ncbi:formyltransferase [Glaciimonas sp. Gout2]|uniref:formyltransferase n=2 Tax=Glaciimonas TaxID=1229970 RepID=UPI002AB5B345|nr:MULTISPECIES: formyltransferase [unclassified Glaciimonas]MDY7548182.1 formyltransferase [Glaciimonas sp. CA11.2]MEB0010661.1 formyltransferase [Glaciimonas sp. Cout2]MEB0084890.1 formyltransferase [Glaciimonas sp. Gout2]